MLTERQKIDLITQFSLDINKVKDLDLLLESILTNARKFFSADAGSIYLKHGHELRFSYAQNATLQKRLAKGKKLIYTTFTIPINTRSIAGYVARNCASVNIPDVAAMDPTTPYRWDPEFDKVSRYTTRSMLTVPMTNHRGEVLGVMQLINAQDEAGQITAFSPADEPLIVHFATSAALALERAQMTRNIILRMISMAELRDPKETGAHVNRVGAYAVELYEVWARDRGLPSDEVERTRDTLRMAAMLHDVGKVAISDLILKKPERLSAEEFEVIKSHTFIGARLFHDIHSDFEEAAAQVALTHHEQWDGTGYPGHIDPLTARPLPGYERADGRPRGKKGEEIPLFGRIVAVADVYDALRSRRSYKEPWDEERIMGEMKRLSGTQFDPALIDAFFSCIDMLKAIAGRYPDNGEG
jgi:HD-GYP domain-containing protein (c-di-GMP phosphodiesterase class II)